MAIRSSSDGDRLAVLSAFVSGAVEDAVKRVLVGLFIYCDEIFPHGKQWNVYYPSLVLKTQHGEAGSCEMELCEVFVDKRR